MAKQAMLIDLTRCIGCDACTVACKQENGTPVDVFFARVLNVEAGAYPDVKRIYIPVLCNHCENPACLKACPNKAIFKREDGIVLIDQDRCRGTGACVSACPYGNIVLTEKMSWYLPDDRAYERDFVRPRLKENVARKCTFCAQRVDDGLEPACVVACPTTARIFGDLDDPESKISVYAEQQQAETGRAPFHLLPEAGTEPANMYLAPMARQEVSTIGGRAEPPMPASAPPIDMRESPQEVDKSAGLVAALRVLVLFALLFSSVRSMAQSADAPGLSIQRAPDAIHRTNAPKAPGELGSSNEANEVWSSASCAGCHGTNAMGGFGPPLAGSKLTMSEFEQIVRKGKGMMPAVPRNEVSDTEAAIIHTYVQSLKLDPNQIPISYKVGALLSVRNVSLGFSIIGTISLLLALKVLLYWVHCAGWKQLQPYLRKFGYGRAAWVALRALVVDGFLVASLWRKDRFRWVMHGLMLYGFIALGAADILMSVMNPLRSQLPMMHPLKVLPNVAGLIVLFGVLYVRVRYRKDDYIDNGLTLGRDYLFINLIAITILSGFAVQALRYAGAIAWVLPCYALHLGVVATLLISAPFTRFSHAFVVPVLVAITRLTDAIVASRTTIGFNSEPSPGRHHKSERIAAGVLKAIDPDFDGKIRLRYYP